MLDEKKPEPVSPTQVDPPKRWHLPDEYPGKLRKITIYPAKENPDDPMPDPIDIYVGVGLYPDGTPGSVEIHSSKMGSKIHGMLTMWAMAVTHLLQLGVRPERIYQKFQLHEFAPKGMTTLPGVLTCKSIPDLVVQYLKTSFPPTAKIEVGEEKDEYDSMMESLSRE